jgi:hypothetical protein
MSAQEQQQVSNGNGKFNFSIPDFGCKGCKDRKQIMGAGNWQVDVTLLLLILAGCYLFYKVKIA